MRDRTTLRKLLRVVVEEWSLEDVESALSGMRDELSDATNHINRELSSQRRKRKAKPNAQTLVEDGGFQGAQRAALLKIANRFDRKEFLPSVFDVREFILVLGERPKSMKDRSDSFRVLLQSLRRLSPERLDEIERNSMYSGPSQLGPLSDAISEARASLTRNQDLGVSI